MIKEHKIETLMLIDDDELDHILCERLIKRCGLVKNFIHFYYAEEALEYLSNPSNGKVDIIALDINMPRMDGFEFLDVGSKTLAGSFADTSVVMLTTSMSADDEKKAREYQVVRDYFKKPLTQSHLDGMLKILND